MNKALALTVLIIIVLVPIGVMAGFPPNMAAIPSITGASLLLAFFGTPA
jgi:hypothetical protein